MQVRIIPGLGFSLKPSQIQAWNIAYPVIVGSIAQNIISIIDTYYLGHVGIIELGAGGLSLTWYFTLIVLGMGLGTGIQVLSSRKLGENRLSEVGSIVDTGIILSVGLGLLIMLFHQFASPFFLNLICKSELIAKAASDFLFWRSFDVPFAMILWSMRGFFNGIQDNKILILTAIIMAVVTATGGYVLIFGKFGFPALKLDGAGIASMTAQIVATIAMVIYFYWKKFHIKYQIFQFKNLHAEYFRELIAISTPTAMQYFIGMCSFFFFLNIIEKMGEEALAASELVKNIYIMFTSTTWGFSTAASAMVGQLVGMRKFSAIQPILKSIIGMALLAAFLSSVILVILPEQILSAFTQKTELIQDSIPLMYLIFVCLVLYGVASAMLQAVIGAGGSRYALWIEIMTLSVYLLYLVVLKYSSIGTLFTYWISEFIYIGGWWIGAIMFFRSKAWDNLKQKYLSIPIQSSVDNELG